MAKIEWIKTDLSDPRVAAHLADALNANDKWRNKIRLDKNTFGKKCLRVHRAADGRFYVRCGFRGSGRSYLSDRCQITMIDGDLSMFLFYLQIYDASPLQEAA